MKTKDVFKSQDVTRKSWIWYNTKIQLLVNDKWRIAVRNSCSSTTSNIWLLVPTRLPIGQIPLSPDVQCHLCFPTILSPVDLFTKQTRESRRGPFMVGEISDRKPTTSGIYCEEASKWPHTDSDDHRPMNKMTRKRGRNDPVAILENWLLRASRNKRSARKGEGLWRTILQ